MNVIEDNQDFIHGLRAYVSMKATNIYFHVVLPAYKNIGEHQCHPVCYVDDENGVDIVDDDDVDLKDDNPMDNVDSRRIVSM